METDESISPIDLTKINTQSFNTWKEEYNQILKTWRKLSAINMWLSQASKHKYDKINNLLAYPSIILSVFISIGIIGVDTCDSVIGTYILASITLVSAILTTINKHMGAAEKAHEFYVRSKEYYALIREIDYLLSLNMNDRPEPYETIIRMRANLEKIIDNQMDFPLSIIRDYEHKFRSLESSIFVDLEAEKIKNDNDVVSLNRQQETVLQHATSRMPLSFQNHPAHSIIMMPYQLHRSDVPLNLTHMRRSTDSTKPQQSKKLDDSHTMSDQVD